MKPKIIEPDLEQSVGKILSRYHEEFSKDDSKEWLLDYCKKNNADKLSTVSSIAKTNLISTYGFLARIHSRGYDDDSIPLRISKYLSSLSIDKDSEIDDSAPVIRKAPTKFDLNPFLEKIDHLVDAFLSGDTEFDIMKEIKIHDIPNQYLSEVRNELKNYEFDISLEEYSYIGVRKYQKLQSMLLIPEKVRKQKIKRKRKIDPHKVISKLNYMPSHDVIGDGIHPIHVIGAKSLITFNTQKRIITLYKAKDVTGLSIKGSSITNYDEKIISKQIKNPIPILEQIKTWNTISEMVNGFSTITSSKEIPTKSLINKYTLLIKVI